MKFTNILKSSALALLMTITATSSLQAAEDVKFAHCDEFKILNVGNEHKGIYPFLGVMSYYMGLPEMKGKYKLRYVGNLYKSPAETLTAVATGAMQMTNSSPAFLEQFNPNWKIASAPGVFADFNHFNRTMQNPEWQAMIKELEEKQNIKIVKWAGNLGSFMLFTKKPINSLEDVKGLRIRYNGATGYIPALEALGATPVALPYTEVVSSLQTNMIDGLISEIQAHSYYDLARYSSNLVPITLVSAPMCLVVNATWWNNLDEVSKKIFTLAFDSVNTSQYLDEEENELIEAWGTDPKGSQKSNFSAEETARWEKVYHDAGIKFLDGVPQGLIDAVEAARAPQ